MADTQQQNPELNLQALREELRRRDATAFVVPRADEYLGEYIPEHNERLRWLTGFTGSAGMAVVLADRAAMFTDGRYTVQVRRQVSAADYEYRHLIEEPALPWLGEQLSAGDRVLVDTRMCSLNWYREAERILGAVGVQLIGTTDNPIDACWHDRPAAKVAPALLLGEEFTGEGSEAKRQRVGALLQDRGLDAALVFAADSVSWLLNIRGRDVPRLPVLLSYGIIEADGTMHVVVRPERIPPGFDAHVGPGVRVVSEEEGAALLANWDGTEILGDPVGASAWTQLSLEQGGATLVAGEDPVQLMKACKNSVEVEGARQAHRRDAVAEIRFLAWLDGEVEAGRFHDEAVLANRLGEFRGEGELFHEPSFDTISAAAANGAMCHYNHLDNEPAATEPDSLYLVDSGGQYSDGTTDITRTVVTGTPSKEMRELFTLVLKGHIALDRVHFPAGTTGTHLDVLARQFLWQTGRDYDHGTGHGVGAFLSVHEGPQRIAKAWNATALRPGMIVSNEPGYYREGEFGIRCENLCVVQEIPGAGQEVPMLGFEALTLVPFDRRLIDRELLSEQELAWLDAYHERVRVEVGPLISDAAVRDWLERATAPLGIAI